MIRRPPRSTLFPLHDALPISEAVGDHGDAVRHLDDVLDAFHLFRGCRVEALHLAAEDRSEEHTSELQSLAYLVCRLLLEKKKKNTNRLHQRQIDMSQHRATSS